MNLRLLLQRETGSFSFEMFPPKPEDSMAPFYQSAQDLAVFHPDFVSVTYGAGGGARGTHTFEAVKYWEDTLKTPSLAHLTCISSSKKQMALQIEELKQRRIENVLALRGDMPADLTAVGEYTLACQLIRELKENGDFCVGAACYPDGHTETANREQEFVYAKEKQDAGCDFFATQMFFDNESYYQFLYRMREAGITKPILAGILPVTNAKQFQRIAKLSGAVIPAKLKRFLDHYGNQPKAMAQAGIAFAIEQIAELLSGGVSHIHLYVMNRADVAAALCDGLSELRGVYNGDRSQ